MKRTLWLFLSLRVCVLIGLFIALYFAPLTITDHVNVWFSNEKFECFVTDDITSPSVYRVRNITSHGSDDIQWSASGLVQDVYV